MHEPAVTLTDYGLTIECWAFALLIARAPGRAKMGSWWVVFFAFIGTASLLGGTVHGYFPDATTLVSRVLWDSNLVALGVTSVAAWNIGALLTESPGLKLRLPQVALALLVAYVAVILFVTNRFIVAIVMYLPAAVFLLVTMTKAHLRDRSRGLGIGIAGLALTFVAAAVQQIKIAIHPV